jgi:hypothetical protein
MQYSIHCQEGIAEASIFQSLSDGAGGVSCAQLVVPHMGVNHILCNVRRVGIQGNDIESRDLRMLLYAIQMQFQPELTQINPFQFNGIGNGREQMLPRLDGYIYKLLLELNQFVIEIAKGGLQCRRTMGLILGLGCRVLELSQVIVDLCVHLSSSSIPAAGAGLIARFDVLD